MALATLWASRIIDGKNIFEDVPKGLKAKVKEILIEAGCENLAKE